MKAWLIAGAGLLASTAAQGRCADVSVQISGLVTQQHGEPVLGATVWLEWSEIGGVQKKYATSATDTSGRFTESIAFYPWAEAKWFWQHYRCDSPPPTVTYRIMAPGYGGKIGSVRSSYVGTSIHVVLQSIGDISDGKQAN